jgi:2-polyprenyl-3-methyl-5-hydroxy-6-metoxy-1,4-benzoquinol methylase
MTVEPVGEYDAYATEYRVKAAERERGGVDGDPMGILPRLFEWLGDVSGRRVLDAGCGDGYLARFLAARGARVTGIDISPRLIEAARRLDPAGQISYLVADLTRPQPELAGSFDAAASYLVLNDLDGYRDFIATLGALLRPGGRLVLAMVNPYGAVIRRHVADYFDSGAADPYRGLWTAGIKTYYHHRTLEEYVEAFAAAGLRLHRLADLPTRASVEGPDTILPPGGRFPIFMLLALIKGDHLGSVAWYSHNARSCSWPRTTSRTWSCFTRCTGWPKRTSR